MLSAVADENILSIKRSSLVSTREMSDEIMEALDSGTSSESESDSIKSPKKDCETLSLSPRKVKIASPISNENSNSSSDLPLISLVKKKKTQLAILSEDETESSTSNATEKQDKKPSNVLLLMDENSSSSDIPLIKLASNKKLHEANVEAPSSNVSVSADENSCSSDVPLSKLVRSPVQHTNSEAKKVKNQLQKKKTVNQSKKNNSKLEVMSDDSNASCASGPTSLVEQEDSDPNSSSAQARKTPKGNIKKKLIKTKKLNEKNSLKRKRSEETGSEQKRVKTKRKRNISSDSSSDDAVKSETVTPEPISSKKNGIPATTVNDETVPATTDSKSSPPISKTKLGPASRKKKSSVQNDVTISPTKAEVNTNPPSSNSKPIDAKKTKVLDKNGILEKLDNSSNSSSSSEDSEVEDPSSVENNVASQSSSSSESGEDPDTIVSSSKRKKKVLQKKANGTTKNASSGSASDSDDPVPRKTSNASTTKGDELPGCPSSGSSSSEESENVSPQKKKATTKDEKSSKKEATKEKKNPGDNPRIIRLQRYLKEAGIRVQNYKILWQNCKSDKARAQKLLELLHERGLKGKPSVSECRKLKKKFEREKEVSELNTSNIITSNGRSRRGVTSLFATRRSPSPASQKKQETSPKKSPEFKKMFGRLKNIVDSEDSD